VPVYIRVQPAIHASDREEVFRFRHRVQAAELGRRGPGGAPGRDRITDELDDHARILVAVDDSSGAILGTLRALLGCDRPFSDALHERLDISSMAVAFGEERLCHSDMFMVDPAYRGQTVASQLIAGLVELMLAQGLEIDLCQVEMAQARSWFQLGYRPYGPIVPSPGGGELRIPLALVLRDRAYLQRVGSPLLRMLGTNGPDGSATARRLRELYPHFEDQAVTPRPLDSFWASVAHTSGAARSASLFEGLPGEQLEPLLDQLPTVRVAADQALEASVEPHDGLGLILKGRLGLTMEQGDRPFFVSVLQPGEVFGSQDGIPTTPPAARMVALEDTELLQLPADLPRRLELRTPGAGDRLRANLGDILAQRLDATNRQVAGFMRGSPERIPLSEELGVEAHSPLDDGAPPSSPEELEAALLARAGLPEQGTLLDPWSGGGEAARMLARLYPLARVVGVEADPRRRSQAESAAREAGLADHCTFLAGEPTRLPLEAGTVDGAYLRLGLHRHPDPGAVLRELHRVMRPGGRVALLDLDDGGMMVHPEPPGFAALQRRLDTLQRELGGDRRAGRSLPDRMDEQGFELLGTAVLPLTPDELPFEQLVELVFLPRLDLLRAHGELDHELEATFAQLLALPARAGSWLCAPLVLAWGERPEAPPAY
jgi:SAM-dependent methyltransferase/GNAT superfamily N-acetyltransferase